MAVVSMTAINLLKKKKSNPSEHHFDAGLFSKDSIFEIFTRFRRIYGIRRQGVDDSDRVCVIW